MFLADYQIEALQIIQPFSQLVRSPGVISYGVAPFGYDVRLGTDFAYLDAAVTDPKKQQLKMFHSTVPVTIPPRGFLIAETYETIRVPRNVLGLIQGKSTYDRCGLIVKHGSLQPEWEGKLVLELINATDRPILLYPLEGIVQLSFAESVNPRLSYRDVNGLYNDQLGVSPSRVRQ